MNMDMERDLAAAGDGMAELVETLRAAPQARVDDGFGDRVMRAVAEAKGRRSPLLGAFRAGPLVAAAAVAALMLAFGSLVFRPAPRYSTAYLVSCQRSDGTFGKGTSAPYAQAFAVKALSSGGKGSAALSSAVAALVRSQNADGGWGDGSTSARNVAALAAVRTLGVEGAAVAYKRGLRYLRVHGIAEMSAVDLERSARGAMACLGADADRALACSVALCAGKGS